MCHGFNQKPHFNMYHKFSNPSPHPLLNYSLDNESDILFISIFHFSAFQYIEIIFSSKRQLLDNEKTLNCRFKNFLSTESPYIN